MILPIVLNKEEIKKENFNHQIAFNAIPQIDVFLDNDYTKEEMKMVNETHKILHDPELPVTATCVRIPVIFGHGESLNIELNNDFKVEAIKELFAQTKNVEVIVTGVVSLRRLMTRNIFNSSSTVKP